MFYSVLRAPCTRMTLIALDNQRFVINPTSRTRPHKTTTVSSRSRRTLFTYFEINGMKPEKQKRVLSLVIDRNPVFILQNNFKI